MRFLQIKKFCLVNLIHRKRSPFPIGEGSRKSRFLAIDECAVVTAVAGGASSSPTGETFCFVNIRLRGGDRRCGRSKPLPYR